MVFAVRPTRESHEHGLLRYALENSAQRIRLHHFDPDELGVGPLASVSVRLFVAAAPLEISHGCAW